jgi:hypothetical protein
VRAVHDDDRVNAEVRAIMAASRIADLRDTAAEISVLKAAAARELPILPLDAVEREAVLTVLVLRERDYARRSLALVERLIDADKSA